jgi:hypothetical protein
MYDFCEEEKEIVKPAGGSHIVDKMSNPVCPNIKLCEAIVSILISFCIQ